MRWQRTEGRAHPAPACTHAPNPPAPAIRAPGHAACSPGPPGTWWWPPGGTQRALPPEPQQDQPHMGAKAWCPKWCHPAVLGVPGATLAVLGDLPTITPGFSQLVHWKGVAGQGRRVPQGSPCCCHRFTPKHHGQGDTRGAWKRPGATSAAATPTACPEPTLGLGSSWSPGPSGTQPSLPLRHRHRGQGHPKAHPSSPGG